MTIFDEASRGTLMVAGLTRQELESKDPITGYTLLATTVVSGYPDLVEELLRRGADATKACTNGETPLLLAAWKAMKERALILQKILRPLKGDYKEIDRSCDVAESNTPLMLAIKNLDVDSVRLLAGAGASLDTPNDDGFNAVEVAQNTGKRSVHNALKPQEEEHNFMRLSSSVLTVMRHIVSRANDMFQGAMSTVFGFEGEHDASTEEALRRRQSGAGEPSPEEFVELVDTYVQEKPMLNHYFKNNKRFMQDIAAKAVELAKNANSDLGREEVLPKTIEVTLHQQVIYCDDSGSMINSNGRAEDRWPGQRSLALRISRITTLLLPDGEGVALRFINHAINNPPNLRLEGIGEILNSFSPQGDTYIGKGLRERILQPMVYEPLEKGELKRPLLVTILTDGAPSANDEELAAVMIHCGEMLAYHRHPRDAVKFLIGQIGSSSGAQSFLSRLDAARQQNPALARVLHIFAGRLDEQFKSMRDGRKLDRWLIETLAEPLRLGASI
ncbi:hypothetical protein FB567DRAFT_630257 [Paraphoma chrysanthemicola]|uniref:Ankyrin repeat protein n=1 Tax=Paraphoma chrysanthemicola TaxID=798071 RepID=A0A8K0R2V1_9PLEO|nr:hypothetical protein FB567DRAFT_630257 [Paraphoma chrysanthemicola]